MESSNNFTRLRKANGFFAFVAAAIVASEAGRAAQLDPQRHPNIGPVTCEAYCFVSEILGPRNNPQLT